MYSAAPGAVVADGTGDTSLFVGELLKEIRTPNLTAEEVFNRTRVDVARASNNEQTPWVASSLTEDFRFGTPANVAAAPAPAPATKPPAPAPTPAPAPPPAAQAPTPKAPAPAPPAAAPAPVQTGAEYKPGDTFRDCPDCSEMVVVPAGSFNMGSSAPYEGPAHKVSIAKPFAIGRFEVTFDEWDHCVADKRCSFKPDDRGLGRGSRPVSNVSWLDTKEFIAWLCSKTGKTYRLPSEAEWEYAARGGTSTVFWWGRDIGQGQANCRECNTGRALEMMPVGSFKPNPFGVFDTAGNAAEWVEDCWNDAFRGAPQDGSAWTTGQCNLRVLRGGAYDSQAKSVGSSARFRYDYDVRYPANGFRVVRQLQ
jgi:formylglycine-generating enzyme required for sulfatase activity